VSVKVRFAPSPTGVLHIGSVRTALFNWLFARHNNGKFLLRIEDTDKLRSTKENINSIFEILEWLNINWDEEPVIQSSRLERHKELALELVERGKAYFCYCTPEELASKKELSIKEGRSYKYDRKCRDFKAKRSNIPAAIRLKSEIPGSTIVHDIVQGRVEIENSQLDDLVLLRSDGTPTYMLSVVADDHDMGITHVIRGDDHLTNTFRQIQIYKAFGWDIPQFAHIPLIYGPDGLKLSKRHGASSAQDYRQLGYLPEAISNYLLRLGWSHGDDEIISKSDAIKWFDLNSVGKSPARFDIAKLQNLNAHYIRERSNESLLELIKEFSCKSISEDSKNRILKGMNSLKERARTLKELAQAAEIYISEPLEFEESCKKYASPYHLDLLKEIVEIVENYQQIDEQTLCDRVKVLAKEKNTKLVEIAQSIRGALCGKLVSPSVFEIMEILGKTETIKRLQRYIATFAK
jgi:glutamyl-tRNA synthetase